MQCLDTLHRAYHVCQRRGGRQYEWILLLGCVQNGCWLIFWWIPGQRKVESGVGLDMVALHFWREIALYGFISSDLCKRPSYCGIVGVSSCQNRITTYYFSCNRLLSSSTAVSGSKCCFEEPKWSQSAMDRVSILKRAGEIFQIPPCKSVKLCMNVQTQISPHVTPTSVWEIIIKNKLYL